jgi:ABC-type nickel/cobalt efflux system permease component RcnA
VRPGGALLARGDGAETVAGATVVGGVSGSFQRLATRYDGSPVVALTALLAALLLGAGHALAPGHGKTIMAFYLSGRRQGALRAAATVGATVTATHTAGVLLLGVLVGAGTAFVPARLYPWLGVLSGLLVLGVGLSLLRSARHGHVHGPGGHVHGPGGHVHGPGGHHPPTGRPAAAVHAGVLVAAGHPGGHGHGPADPASTTTTTTTTTRTVRTGRTVAA